MNHNPENTNLELIVSQLINKVEAELPIHLNLEESVLLKVVLAGTIFPSLTFLLEDVKIFLKQEVDLSSITRENVSDINFSALATKFGNRYHLSDLVKRFKGKNEEIAQLGWKSIRTILIKVLLPQLKKVDHADAQYVVGVLGDFIWSYSLINGEKPTLIMEELQYWEIFKDYEFTLEPDAKISTILNQLPPSDEYIKWCGSSFSARDAGKALEQEYGLILDENEWANFFEGHTQQIRVKEGKLNMLIPVLFQLENKELIAKSKRKGCWKIWQLILVDEDRNPFRQELRKISSKINSGRTKKDQVDYDFGLSVVTKMIEIEKSKSQTIEDYNNIV